MTYLRLLKKTFFFSHSVLADDSAGKSGDLYIRSVCFSPDGKYLATGAEDKQIRVRFFSKLFSLSFSLGLWKWLSNIQSAIKQKHPKLINVDD